MYMRPFLLNVFFSKRFVHAKVVHRGTSECIIETGAWQRDGQRPEASAEGGDAGTVGRGRQRVGERRQSPSMPVRRTFLQLLLHRQPPLPEPSQPAARPHLASPCRRSLLHLRARLLRRRKRLGKRERES
uniref:Uncharacterized protein n=1 Tax=Oryza nivara TaxID=4536 RepID=A0A0E0HRG3_ORYNI